LYEFSGGDGEVLFHLGRVNILLQVLVGEKDVGPSTLGGYFVSIFNAKFCEEGS
jgi:hypothetical protein